MGKLKRDSDKQAFWQLAISEQRGSALSVRGFCQREGLSEASFYSWRRTLAERGAEGSASMSKDPAFVEVTPTDHKLPPAGQATDSPVQVLLPCGAVVRVQAGFDAALLRQVVEVLS